MNYVVLDLEWNQPEDHQPPVEKPFRFASEIIEIGAVRLDENFEPAGEFKTYVRPTFYPVLKSAIVQLTKIRPNFLREAPLFPEALQSFLDWCGTPCCLCTWSRTDCTVLLDNMLMHRLSTADTPWFCDLQRVFGREMMNVGRRVSLEHAAELLGLPEDRSAHDALSDARNTARICARMDLPAYVEEYCFRYVGNGEDRLAGLIGGKPVSDWESAFRDEELCSITCPYCGERVLFGGWAGPAGPVSLGYGKCSEGDEFLCRLQRKRGPDGTSLCRRVVCEMSDDLWDLYQTALDEGMDGTAEAATAVEHIDD